MIRPGGVVSLACTEERFAPAVNKDTCMWRGGNKANYRSGEWEEFPISLQKRVRGMNLNFDGGLIETGFLCTTLVLLEFAL